jgi:AGCS family alanine or glycine:cation symporter
MRFLFGSEACRFFVFLQTGASVASVLLNTGMVWMLAETVNGLMAMPNLLALAALSPVLFRLVYQQKKERPAGAP